LLHASGGNTYAWLKNGQTIFGVTDSSYYATQTGAYNIVATNTCGNDTSGTITLEASAQPVADFYTLEDHIYEEAEMHFIDKSIDASAWMWQLADGSPATFIQNPVHTYADSGVYAVTLIVMDNLGCTDTITKNIVIHAIPPFFIPNVFTPNGDGIHDKLEIEYGRLTDIELSIFDRWGNKIFVSNKKDYLWDGTQAGYDAQAGVYFYKVTANDAQGNPVHYEGNVTLVR
jgi:gliding motility-associated-like protein